MFILNNFYRIEYNSENLFMTLRFLILFFFVFKGTHTMQISSNKSSTANSTEEFDSEINEQLNNTLISSTSNEVREISKISFSVTKQKTTKVVSQNKLLGKRDRDEDEEEDDQSRKRGILHLENGVPIE